MTVAYKVAGGVTLKADSWESDPCLKLHIETHKKKTYHFFTVTWTLLGLSTLTGSVQIPLLLFLPWTDVQWKPFYAITL